MLEHEAISKSRTGSIATYHTFDAFPYGEHSVLCRVEENANST